MNQAPPTRQTVRLKYLNIAPRKVRLIANTLKGLSTKEAEAQLLLRPQRAHLPLLKLLRSAMANAKQNQKENPDQFFVANIWVDAGPMLKRFLPRAQGRATPIHKKTSHVTLILEKMSAPGKDRFTILIPEKKKKTEKKPAKAAKPGRPEKEVVKEKAVSTGEDKGNGVLKRIFRRKSV